MPSGAIVIDLLEDTPRPTSRLAQCKTKKDINTEIVLSDDSDNSFRLEERRTLKHSKRRPSSTLASQSGCLPSQHVETPTKTRSIAIARNATKAKTAVDSDPVVFTSPIEPVLPSRVRRAHKAPVSSGSDFTDLTVVSDYTNSSQLCKNTGTQLSDRTASLLATLKGTSSHREGESSGSCQTNKVGAENHFLPSRKRKEIEYKSLANLGEILATPPKKARKGRLSSAEKQERCKEKERARLAREADKRTAKESRQNLKELRALEKQIASELASANKLKVDKKISTSEMIVDLPFSLEGSPLGNQIQSFLGNIRVEVVFAGPCPIPNVISWRRKVVTRYNEDLGHWEPIQEQIRNEKHIMCLTSANDFVEMARGGPNDVTGMDIDTHVLQLKSKFEGCSPIYLIEGLGAWMRKNNNIRNRAFQAAVLYQGDENTDQNDPQGGGSRRKKPVQQYMDADIIEDALLRVQVVHKCLIHHTATAVETAEWVSNFTQHISTIPYRNQRIDLETSFCMESGQVKTGEDKNDTYVRMLQEIVRVTGPVAYGIAAEYPDVPRLMNGFREHGPTALQDLRKTANKNGAFTNNNIGKAISKRVYNIVMGTDPTSNEV